MNQIDTAGETNGKTPEQKERQIVAEKIHQEMTGLKKSTEEQTAEVWRAFSRHTGTDLEKLLQAKNPELEAYLREYQSYSAPLLERVVALRLQRYEREIEQNKKSLYLDPEEYQQRIKSRQCAIELLKTATSEERRNVLAKTEYIFDVKGGSVLPSAEKPTVQWPRQTFVATVGSQWAATLSSDYYSDPNIAQDFDAVLSRHLQRTGNLVDALRLTKASGCSLAQPTISHREIRAFEKQIPADRRVLLVYHDKSFINRTHGALRGQIASTFNLNWSRDTSNVVEPSVKQVEEEYQKLHQWANTNANEPKELLIMYYGHGWTVEGNDGNVSMPNELNEKNIVDKGLKPSDRQLEGSLQGIFFLNQGKNIRLTEDQLKQWHQQYIPKAKTIIIFHCCHSSAFQP